MNGNPKPADRAPYEKPKIDRHGTLKEITLISFNPPPPDGDRAED